MKTSLRPLFFLHCAPGLLLAMGAQAQSAAPAPLVLPDVQQIAADARWAAQDMVLAAQDAVEAQGDVMAFAHVELAQARVVKGAPYCADAVHESVQPLADGNRIVHSQSTRLCRDSEGRTRQDVERNGHRMVYLRDPVAKESWVLDVDKKSARKLGGMAMSYDSAAWETYAEQMHEWAQQMKVEVREQVAGGKPAVPPVPPRPPQPPAPVVLSQTDKTSTDAQGHEHRQIQVQVLRVEPSPGLPPLPALQAPMAVLSGARVFAPRGLGVHSTLGSQDMAGVKVNGERTSWTIEAGKIGNEKPLVITRDVWTSPELMVTVASRDFDPRSGETNYRLQNLKRGEPEAALMKVPADYATQAQPEKREITIERKQQQQQQKG